MATSAARQSSHVKILYVLCTNLSLHSLPALRYVQTSSQHHSAHSGALRRTSPPGRSSKKYRRIWCESTSRKYDSLIAIKEESLTAQHTQASATSI